MAKIEFNDEYMGGFWDNIRFWLLIKRIKRQKTRELWEANIDKYYFETQHRELLEYDDTEDRNFLQTEGYKPEGNRDLVKLAEVQEKIANAKSIKQAYRKNEEFRTGVKIYLDMINKWWNKEEN